MLDMMLRYALYFNPNVVCHARYDVTLCLILFQQLFPIVEETNGRKSFVSKLCSYCHHRTLQGRHFKRGFIVTSHRYVSSLRRMAQWQI